MTCSKIILHIVNTRWVCSLIHIHVQYTYIVGKYKIYLCELSMPVSQRVQMNFTFTDNVRILCLSCNVKEVGKLVRFRQKGQKQASFLAFHKCCQGCLLRGPRYQFHTCLRPPQYIATGYQESLFVG